MANNTRYYRTNDKRECNVCRKLFRPAGAANHTCKACGDKVAKVVSLPKYVSISRGVEEIQKRFYQRMNQGEDA